MPIDDVTPIADVGEAAILVADIENRLGLATYYAGAVVKMLASIAAEHGADSISFASPRFPHLPHAHQVEA